MREVIPFDLVVDVSYEHERSGVVARPWYFLPGTLEAANQADQEHFTAMLQRDGQRVARAAQAAGLEPDYYQRRLIQLQAPRLGWVVEMNLPAFTRTSPKLSGVVLNLAGELTTTDKAPVSAAEALAFADSTFESKLQLLARTSELNAIRPINESDFEFQRGKLARFMVAHQLQLQD